MSGFLDAIKADLLDRRLRAAALLLLAALVAAIAYAATGGGSAPATPSPAPSPASTPASAGSIAPVAAVPNPNHALAETPSGAARQRRGALRNPFTPLPGSATSSAPATSAKSVPTTGANPEAVKAKQRAAECLLLALAGGSCASKKTTPPAPKPTYEVSVALGPLPPGTPPQSAQLTPYQNLKFQQKLPSPSLRLLEFTGVASGKKAMFKLIGEVIPKGGLATCTPSPTQCQTIELETGQAEELEYLPPTGPAQVYELQVVSVAVH
jgi:hypothetical protein